MTGLQWSPMWLILAHSLSRAYVAKASGRGIAASMITLPGEGHQILNNAAVIEGEATTARRGH
jgi:hypothetical protein